MRGRRPDTAGRQGVLTPEGQPALYAAIAESSVRLRGLIDHVYYRYIKQGMSMDAGGRIGTLVLPPSTGTVLMYVRYLAIELGDFARLYMRNHAEITSGLGGGELGALRCLMEGQEDAAGRIRNLRAGVGDGSGLLLREVASRVSPGQLEQMLLYARLVIEFQGRIAGGDAGRGGFTAPEWRSILAGSRPRSFDQACNLRDGYGKVRLPAGASQHLREYSLMYERWEGMQMLRDMLNDCIGKFEKEASFKTERLTWTSYMVKYLVIDLANFTSQYEKLDLEPSAGFARRRKTYALIYSRHLAVDGGCEEAGVAHVVRNFPGLMGMALDDVEEAGFFVDRIRAELARVYAPPDSPLYSPNLADINQKFEQARARAGACVAGPGPGAAAGDIARVFEAAAGGG